jgi:hypothetical protein
MIDEQGWWVTAFYMRAINSIFDADNEYQLQ